MKLKEAVEKYEPGKPIVVSWCGDNYDEYNIATLLFNKKCSCGSDFGRWGLIGHPHAKPKGRGKEFKGAIVCEDCFSRIQRAILKYYKKAKQ